jgi:hypothetical protein
MSRLFSAIALLLATSLAIADRVCENEALVIDARFDGGRMDHCEFSSENVVELTFRTEDFRVEDAFAWFSFRVVARDSREIRIKMHFPDAYARFWPKLSRDGDNWVSASEDNVARSTIGKSMILRLPVDEKGTWVSAQELLTQDYYDDWLEQLDAHYELQISDIGRSNQDRPIQLAHTGDKPEAIVLIGRQHPAEVPGAIAMREFVDVVLGSS